ncbi:hypothetical protein JTE90_025451 [Oedothorax gibbosus]|uniref:Uncharacterized protein n=1 Tax=Oedothorax gibbosus TaxID=931172 RepID=A0AAV6U9V6_9ARAC|nr:hypothetical protein JTE90_025451 [Oedothorax gibbosus]
MCTINLTQKTFNTFLGILVAIDVIIWMINIYCILCVVSHYQQYIVEPDVIEPFKELQVEYHCVEIKEEE